MLIRQALDGDLEAVVAVQRQAFDSDEEAMLTRNLLADPSAGPVVSVLAFDGDRPVGHVLFTRARLEPGEDLSVSLLAPLAVVPDWQGKGIGSRLVEEGFRILKERGGDLVFVLGWPDYYQRFGFKPAGALGLEAPYAIADKNADAWRVAELRAGVIDKAGGKLVCADAIDKAEYWVE